MSQVKVYGADWCRMTRQTLQRLDSLGVTYDYIDVETDDSASEWVKEQNQGKEKKPTLDIGGAVLTTPSDKELENTLRAQGIIS